MVYNDLLDSRVTRLTGGDESYAVDVADDVDGKKRLKTKGKVADLIDGTTNENGAITVGTSPVEVKVGITRLTNRRTVTVQPTNGPVWWGWKFNVNINTGTKIFPWQVVTFSVSDNVPIYLVSDSAGRDVRVTEASWVP